MRFPGIWVVHARDCARSGSEVNWRRALIRAKSAAGGDFGAETVYLDFNPAKCVDIQRIIRQRVLRVQNRGNAIDRALQITIGDWEKRLGARLFRQPFEYNQRIVDLAFT